MKLHQCAKIPVRSSENSAGFDLYALEDTLIRGGEGNTKVRTGIAVQLPPGTYGRVAGRSGLAVKHLNVAAGVIDIDYTGEIIVIAYLTKLFDEETSAYQYIIRKGEKFAQLIPEKISYAAGREVTSFDRSYDDHKGFGSTGTGLDN